MPTRNSVVMPHPPAYWTAPNATLYLGDVRECLRALPSSYCGGRTTTPAYSAAVGLILAIFT